MALADMTKLKHKISLYLRRHGFYPGLGCEANSWHPRNIHASLLIESFSIQLRPRQYLKITSLAFHFS